jgi:hypothetical protein
MDGANFILLVSMEFVYFLINSWHYGPTLSCLFVHFDQKQKKNLGGSSGE